MNRWLGARQACFVAMAIVLAVLPATELVYPFFLMQAMCFALFACAFNLLAGGAGLFSFGHAMFFGAGGYAAAHAAKVWGWPPELALALGVLTGAVIGAPTGFLSIRREGVYFSMATLSFAQMIYFFCLQAPFTHGEDGIQGAPRGRLLGVLDLNDQAVLYGFTLCVFLAGFGFILRVLHSPFGEILRAIRDNEQRAISLGYAANRYKLVAFMLSASLAGLAGALKAIVTQTATLTVVHWSMSGDVLLMSLVGGIGTLFGPIAGAFVIVGMQQYLAQFGQWASLTQGLVFMACVLAFRKGIVGEIAARFAHRNSTT